MNRHESTVTIIQAENGFILRTRQPIEEKDGKLLYTQDESELHEAKSTDDKDLATALIETFWSALDEFGIHSGKHDKWIIKMGVHRRKRDYD